jgi:hypothetical protein
MTSAATDIALAPELAALDRQLAANQERAAALVRGMSAEDFNRQPGPGRWSVGECLRHLAVSDASYFVKIDQMIDTARAKGLVRPGPYRLGWFGNFFARTLEPPVKRRMKTQPVFDIETGKTLPVDETLAAFQAALDALRAKVRRANGVDLGAVKTTSPATRMFSFSLGAVFNILAAHQRRHLWQAEQVLPQQRPH